MSAQTNNLEALEKFYDKQVRIGFFEIIIRSNFQFTRQIALAEHLFEERQALKVKQNLLASIMANISVSTTKRPCCLELYWSRDSCDR